MSIDRLALGDYIRTVRESKRLSQRELAAQIDRSRPWLTQLERGSDTVVLEAGVIQCIAAALDIPTSELLKLAGVDLPAIEAGRAQWLAQQMDAKHLRLFLRIGHELLLEQQDQPQMAGRRASRP